MPQLPAETISLTALHQAVGDTVNRVHYGQVPIVVTKRGVPVVMLVPIIGTLDERTNLQDLVARTLGLEYPRSPGDWRPDTLRVRSHKNAEAGEEEQVEG